MEKKKVLEIRDLTISFRTQAGQVAAVRGVNLDLYQGETVAIVGESGSGKSVSVKAIMGILAENGRIEQGRISFYGKEDVIELVGLPEKKFERNVRGKRIAMVFQDPMTSLDPTMSIGKQLMEGMIRHLKMSKAQARARALELLQLVGIQNTETIMKEYPHQLSGGMRQRIVIAIALACNPEILICDEPTTALDVTIQARILQLIQNIQRKLGIAVIYITHDLGVVAKVADHVNVMYAGKIVETGTVDDIFYEPRHPYTWGLLSSMPDLDTKSERLYTIPGNPPNLLNRIEGDAFAPRNPYALAIDYEQEPPMFRINDHHYAATWLLHPDAPKVELPKQLRNRIEQMKRRGGDA